MGLSPVAVSIPTKRQGKYGVRRLTADIRVLPDYVIIGAQKCGTSSLSQYLCEHPDVVPAFRKEVHYFDRNFDKGASWYRRHFPTRVQMTALRTIRAHPVLTGEASPCYLFHPLGHERLHDLLPSARLIALLRDPVERAFSHYRHMVRAGHEQLSFDAAIEAEPLRRSHRGPAVPNAEMDLADPHFGRYLYVERGRYAQQLERWFTCFPRGQLLVLKSEDLFSRPTETFARVLEFLDLRSVSLSNFRVHNAGIDMHMQPEMRRRLVELFTGPNQQLYDLLGVDFGWQRPASPSTVNTAGAVTADRPPADVRPMTS